MLTLTLKIETALIQRLILGQLHGQLSFSVTTNQFLLK